MAQSSDPVSASTAGGPFILNLAREIQLMIIEYVSFKLQSIVLALRARCFEDSGSCRSRIISSARDWWRDTVTVLVSLGLSHIKSELRSTGRWDITSHLATKRLEHCADTIPDRTTNRSEGPVPSFATYIGYHIPSHVSTFRSPMQA